MEQINIEVFKTNVCEMSLANKLVAILLRHFPGSRINFDLDDCDKVLRVEGRNISSEKVSHLLQQSNCVCEVME
jgi:hypothetical protein